MTEIAEAAVQRVDREATREAARVLARREAEGRAAEVWKALATAVGVDALVEAFGLDRSQLYAQARGARPPQLAAFVAALRFDPNYAGREALSALARDIGYQVVPLEAAPCTGAKLVGLAPILAALMEELERAGVAGDIEAERSRLRAAR